MQPRSASRSPALCREPVGARWPSVWFKPCHRRPSRHRVGRFRSVDCVEETVTNPSLRGAWASSASMSGSTYIDTCPNHHAKPAPIPGRHGAHRTDNQWRSAGARIQAAGWARVRALGCAPAQLTAAALDGSALGSRVLVVRLGQASRCAVASRTHRSDLRFGGLRSSRLSRQRLVDPVLSPARPLSQEKPQPEIHSARRSFLMPGCWVSSSVGVRSRMQQPAPPRQPIHQPTSSPANRWPPSWPDSGAAANHPPCCNRHSGTSS